MHQNYLLKHRLLGPIPGNSDSVDLERGLGTGICNKFSEDIKNAAYSGQHFKNCCSDICVSVKSLQLYKDIHEDLIYPTCLMFWYHLDLIVLPRENWNARKFTILWLWLCSD